MKGSIKKKKANKEWSTRSEVEDLSIGDRCEHPGRREGSVSKRKHSCVMW